MKIFLQKVNPEKAKSVLLVFLIHAFTYWPSAASTGFYRDDWYMIWAGMVRGRETIADLFLFDRPFVGVVYSWSYQLLGADPFRWQIFALGLHLLCALLFYWILTRIWPSYNLANLTAAILFVVYPGFLQIPNGATFNNQLLTLAAALLSIGLSIRGVQSRSFLSRIAFNLLGFLTALFYFFLYEYMIGLEAARAIFLWLAVNPKAGFSRQKFAAFFRRWVVYLPTILIYLYWRLFVFESGRNTMNVARIFSEYQGQPRLMLYRLVIETAKDLIETIFLAWAVPFYDFLRSASYSELGEILPWLALILGAVVYMIYTFQYSEGSEEQQKADYIPLFVGTAVVLFTVLPHVVSGRDIKFESGFDRYTLQAIIGAALFWSAFLYQVLRPVSRNLLLIGLVGSAVLTQQLNAQYFTNLWDLQRELWWQTSWRVPDLEDDTVLIAVLPRGYSLFEGYEIWAPANLIYRPDAPWPEIFGQVLTGNTVNKVVLGEVDERVERQVVPIQRDYAMSLVLSLPARTACLHVIDGRIYDLDQNEEPLVERIASNSRTDLIRTSGSHPVLNEEIFGPEPDHGWCYYYQKADLARQVGDWEEISRLADEAFGGSLKYFDRSELLPFLEGYTAVGRLDDAQLLAEVVAQYPPLQIQYCESIQGLGFPYGEVHSVLCP